MIKNICVVYTHHKLGDLIWQLPYIKAISDHHKLEIDLIVREKTQAKNIFRDLKHIKSINYNNFRKGIYYWIDVWKLTKIFNKNKKELLLSDYNSLETKKLHAAAQIAQEGAMGAINDYLSEFKFPTEESKRLTQIGRAAVSWREGERDLRALF